MASMLIWWIAAIVSAQPPRFVGSEACSACHPAIAASYRQSPMARSSGPLRDVLPEGDFRHRASGVRYRMRERAVEFGSQMRRLEFFVGSGQAGRSFLFREDGFLFLAPVTWYTERKAWDMSPGHQDSKSSVWSRPIEPNCLFCHATRAQPVFGTQNRYADPPFLEGGVGCERCHGPGSAHVSGGPIVNPAWLPPDRRDAVCAQCHLTGAARIDRPGTQIALFRPGDSLWDHVSVFVYENAGALRVTSHVEKLSHSACQRASGGKLWCGTCHSIHGAKADPRGKCLECHTAHGPEADCTGCHMPRLRAADANHGVFTDHSIPRSPRGRSAAKSGGALRGFRASMVDDRALGLAYAEVALESNDGGHAAKARALLRQVTAPDAAVLTRRAYIEQNQGAPAEAAALYERSLRLKPAQPVALVNLGLLYGQAGRLPQAIDCWRKALAMNPGLTEASRNLATALRAVGDEAAAREELRKAKIYLPESGR